MFGVFSLGGTVNTSTGNSYLGGNAGVGGAGGIGGPAANPITSVSGQKGVDGTLGNSRVCTTGGGC